VLKRIEEETHMTDRAHGSFKVTLIPQPYEDMPAEAMMGRMSIDKHFSGDLEGTSKGQMLTAGSIVKGSAGYVAIERFTGNLRDRSGTFVLQHSATMIRGAPQMSVTVVPDSGTGQLTGISGSMTIIITGAHHSYAFEYALEEST